MAEPFGAYMRRKRLERSLTLEEVGDLLGTTHVTVQRYESGTRSVNLDVAMRWADVVGVSKKEATGAWVASNGGEIHYIEDPDIAETVEYYEGLSPTSRNIARSLIQQLREAERRSTIGGGSGDRVVEPEPDEDGQRPD